MKTIEQIRLENLIALVSEFESQRRFAAFLERPQSQVNAWFTGLRSIGHTAAREVETQTAKPVGWLDNDHEPRERLSAATVNRVMAEMLPETPQTSPATFAEKMRDAVFGHCG